MLARGRSITVVLSFRRKYCERFSTISFSIKVADVINNFEQLWGNFMYYFYVSVLGPQRSWQDRRDSTGILGFDPDI